MAGEHVDNKFQRCESEMDPERCNGVNGGNLGQCMYKRVPGCLYCPRHGGAVQINQNRREDLRNYHLGKYQRRVDDFANNSEVKSLREEIGITRMLMEETIKKCEDANALLLYSDRICLLVDKIEKLVVSCQKMEEKTNMLIDRKTVIVIADSIVAIIGQHISDPDVMNEIGKKVCDSIEIAASPAYTSGAVA